MSPLWRLVPALLIVAMLAGCSDSRKGTDDPGPTTSSDGSSTTTAPPPAPVADVELANETIQFAAFQGGAATRSEATVPDTHGNVTITYRILTDCPAGYAKSPSLVVETADGTTTTLWTYDVVAPDVNEPYTCPVDGGFSDRERAKGAVTFLAVPGPLTVTPLGEFSADVEVAITVSA